MVSSANIMVVEVLPDVSGLDRTFHYTVPPELASAVCVGTIVRVVLHGRRVRGYVVAVGTEVPAGVTPRDIVQVVSLGPPADVVSLCSWAAWRYAGRRRPFLAAASPPTIVRNLGARVNGRMAAPSSPSSPSPPTSPSSPSFGRAVAELYAYTYDRPIDSLWESGELRAEAMRICDAWVAAGCDLTDPRVAALRTCLLRSYRSLKAAVA